MMLLENMQKHLSELEEAIQMIESGKVNKVTLDGITVYKCANIIRIDLKKGV